MGPKIGAKTAARRTCKRSLIMDWERKSWFFVCLLLFACFIFVPQTGTYYADRRVSTVVSTGAFLLEMSNPDYVFFMVCHGPLCVLYGLSYIRVTFVSRLYCKEVSSKDQPMTASSIIFKCAKNKRLKTWSQHFPMSSKQPSSTGHKRKKGANASTTRSNASSIELLGVKAHWCGVMALYCQTIRVIIGRGDLWVVFSNDKQSICQILIEQCH
jgi:hypothetical protein